MKVHTDWLKATIQQIPVLATRTYITLAKNADGTPVTLPYAVIHPSDGSDQSDRLAGPSLVQNPRFVVHGVGSTYEQAAWVGEQIKAQVIINGFGVIPVIAGEQSGQFWYTSPQPVQVDTDVSPPYCWHTSECGFESTPTA